MSTNPVAAYQAAHPEPEPKWPWAEIDAESERLFRSLKFQVAKIMRDAGENPDDTQLFTARCDQAAYGLSARVRKMRS